MPITKSALKKQRVDKNRTAINERIRASVRGIVRGIKTNKEEGYISKLASTLDRAVAKKQMSKNKAARIKSRLARKLKIK